MYYKRSLAALNNPDNITGFKANVRAININYGKDKGSSAKH